VNQSSGFCSGGGGTCSLLFGWPIQDTSQMCDSCLQRANPLFCSDITNNKLLHKILFPIELEG
jgi:hypothetical protein